MPDPYTLYNGTPPHERRSITSTLAAHTIAPYATTLRERVLQYVHDQGARGATVDEVEAATGMLHQTCSARARELVLFGDLIDTGTMRRTRTGRKASVLIARAHAPSTTMQPDLFGALA